MYRTPSAVVYCDPTLPSDYELRDNERTLAAHNERMSRDQVERLTAPVGQNVSSGGIGRCPGIDGPTMRRWREGRLVQKMAENIVMQRIES